MREQDTEIIFNKKLAPDTFLMGLRSREIVAEGRPGQFVMIRVLQGIHPLLRRPFSICGTREDDLLLILYRVVGMGTSLLSRTREGERLSVLGPLGKGFELPRPGHKSLLVAGGIGLAPLIFLAKAINAGDLGFMAGYRSASEIVSKEEIGLSGIEMSIATDDGTAGHQGPVTDLLEANLNGKEGGDLAVYACGPLPMLERVAALTIARGIACQVSLETSMACGLGACQGCAVKAASKEKDVYYRVCHDGPVFPVQALDWNSL